MKPDWDRLGDFFNRPETMAQIADVDCTADKNEDLCEKYGVDGYPTLKYFSKDTTESGEMYDGPRSYMGLKRFIRAEAKQPCVVRTLENCNQKELSYIDEIKEMSEAYVNDYAAKLLQQLQASKASYEELSELFKKQEAEALKTDDDADLAKAAIDNKTMALRYKIDILNQRLGITTVEPSPESNDLEESEDRKSSSGSGDTKATEVSHEDEDFGSDDLDKIEL
jgi:protein disulfide-isomerase A6